MDKGGGRTSDRILVVALELFVDQGYEKTSIGQIASRVGLTKAALYYHFNAKDDILISLVTPYLQAVDGLLADAPSSGRAHDRRREVLSSYLDVLLEHSAVIRFVARDVSAVNHPRIRGMADEQMRRLREVVAGRTTAAAEVQAASAIGCLLRPLLDLPELDLTRFKDVMLAAAIDVFKTRQRRTPRSPQSSNKKT